MKKPTWTAPDGKNELANQNKTVFCRYLFQAISTF